MADRSIGVDVGGTKVLGVLTTSAGEVQAEERVPTPPGGDAILDSIVEVIEAVRHDLETPAIGVGMPGLVDHDGVLRFAPNLPGVTELAVQSELERRVPGATVRVENDASCAGWGERVLGAARDRDDALLVTLGTGIGGGIISGGRLLTGAHGFAGEIGHMVINPYGPPCRCGQRGCWERYASGSGLGRIGREAANAGQADRVIELAGGDPEDVKGEHVTAAAAEGDAQAGEIFTRFAWWLALGLANLANIYDPSVFVLGGGLVEAGEVLLQPTRTAFAELVEGAEHRPPVDIVPAQLGERAGAIGAAALHCGANGEAAHVLIGTTLPQFREDADIAIAAACRAEALGLDGVFAFDHLWPIGNPEGIVLHGLTLLGALAEETTRVRVGSLVARVGLMPDAVLVNTLASVAHIAGRERTIAGVGAGDALSKAENLAFGVEYESVAVRVAAVGRVCRALRERGVTTWAGGRSPHIRQVAADDADALNIWGASPAEVVSEIEDLRGRVGGHREVTTTWGGQVLIGRTDAEVAAKLERYGPRRHLVQGTVTQVAAHFDAMAEAGVTFAVCAPLDVHDDPAAYETLAEVKQALT